MFNKGLWEFFVALGLILLLVFFTSPVRVTLPTRVRFVPDSYATIQEAVRAAEPGDTIYIRPGFYFENVVIEKPLHIVGEGERSVTVYGRNPESDVFSLRVYEGNVLIQGLKVAGGGAGIRIEIDERAKVTLREVVAYGNRTGIVAAGSGRLSIKNSSVLIGRGGIVVDVRSGVLSGNLILNAHVGILLKGDGNVVISNNTVALCDIGIVACGNGCECPSGGGEVFTGNVFGEGNRVHGTTTGLCPPPTGVSFAIRPGGVEIVQLPSWPWPRGFSLPEWPPQVDKALESLRLGRVQAGEGRLQEALDAFREGIEASTETGLAYLKGLYSYELGSLCLEAVTRSDDPGELLAKAEYFLGLAKELLYSQGEEILGALAQGSLGDVQLMLRQNQLALESWQSAYTILSIWSARDGWRELTVPCGFYAARLGIVYCTEGRYAEAEPLLDYAARVTEWILGPSFPLPIVKEGTAILRTLREIFTNMMADANRSRVLVKAELHGLGTAINYAEHAKARTLVDMMYTAMVLRQDVLPAELQTPAELVTKLVTLGADDRIAAVPHPEAERAVATTRAQYLAVIEELTRTDEALSNLLVAGPEQIETYMAEVKTELGEGVVVLEYFVTRDVTFVWGITADGVLWARRIAISRSELLEKIRDFREELNASPPPGEEVASEFRARELGKELYDLLITPIEDYIQTASHLVIVPSDVLFYLPFAALVRCPGCEGKRELWEGEYLIERYSLSYAPSLASLYWPFRHRGNGVYQRALVVGNPTGDLEYAGEEARGIASLFPRAELVVGDADTKAMVLELIGAGNYDVIHLATHGEFDRELPLASRVYFNQWEPLYAGEMLGLELQGCELVVLSACQTGLPPEVEEELVVGDELEGLPQALFVAGTPSAVLTLWNVNDESTKRLMEEMYQGLMDGVSKAEALRQAQLSLIHDTMYRHPYYWAPFVLYGVWR